MKLKTCFADMLMFIVAKIQKNDAYKISKFYFYFFCVALGAALDNCLCLFFFARRDSITIADVPFV